MPAAVAVPAVIGAVSTGTSILQGISANKRAREIQSQIDNYRRQNLVNPNLTLQVSTLGADRQREDLARTMATTTAQASMGGSRALLGLAPGMIAQQNAQEAQIMAQLDEQERQRQIAVAQGDAMVQQMQERREEQDLAGLGNALNTARQESANAFNQAMQSGLYATNIAMQGLGTDKLSKAINSTTKNQQTGADISANTTVPTQAQIQPFSANGNALPNAVSTFNFPNYIGKGAVRKNPASIFNGSWNFLNG